MGIDRGVGSTKGDIWSPIEILVERSSTNNRTTVTMWKRHDDKFHVAKKVVGQPWEIIIKYEENKSEAEARRVYEDSCNGNGCSPYPEAEAYYKRKGLLQ